MSNPVGVMVATSTPPEKIAGVARSAESLGFGELWVAEDYFCYGGFAGAGVALAATERIKVGIGIVSSVVRHPAVTAMEIATLARVYPGRLLPGIGHGVTFWTDQMNLTPASPLTALKECVSSVRELLGGETLTREGRYFGFDGVGLTHLPHETAPILTGVLGPKSLQLSGRIADGTVMSALAGTKYLESALADIRIGMAESGRTSHLVPTFALFSIDHDAQKARAAVRPALAGYLAAVGPHNPLTRPFGYGDEIAALLEGGVEHTAANLPEEWIDTLAVAGDPAQVTARVTELLEAGATSIVLSPVNVAGAERELALAASDVLPRIG